MESLYNGKVSIWQKGEDLEIHIKAPRNWFLIISFGFCFLMLMSAIINGFLLLEESVLFGIILILPFVLVAFLIFKTLLWWSLGKEIIVFKDGILTIEKSNALFVPTKTYDLGLIKEFWVEREIVFPFYVQIIGFIVNLNFIRLISFNYNNQQVKFGASLIEAEANYIVTFLKENGVLSK